MSAAVKDPGNCKPGCPSGPPIFGLKNANFRPSGTQSWTDLLGAYVTCAQFRATANGRRASQNLQKLWKWSRWCHSLTWGMIAMLRTLMPIPPRRDVVINGSNHRISLRARGMAHYLLRRANEKGHVLHDKLHSPSNGVMGANEPHLRKDNILFLDLVKIHPAHTFLRTQLMSGLETKRILTDVSQRHGCYEGLTGRMGVSLCTMVKFSGTSSGAAR